MTQKFTAANIPGFLIFALIQIALISSAMLILFKPKLIITDKEAFCLILLVIATILLIFNIACAGMTINTVKKDWQTYKAKPRNALLSFFQVSLGFTFAGLGIVLASLIFFEKISEKKAMLFAQIYCGLFAIAMISMIVLSVLSKTIGHLYIQKLIKNNTMFKEIQENKVLKICSFFDNIANILASMNLYVCHLFVHEETRQANKLCIINGEKCYIKGDKNRIIKGCEVKQPITMVPQKPILFSIKYQNQNYHVRIDDIDNIMKSNNIDYEENSFNTLSPEKQEILTKAIFHDAKSENIEIYQYDNQNYQSNEIAEEKKITFNSLGLFIPQLTLKF